MMYDFSVSSFSEKYFALFIMLAGRKSVTVNFWSRKLQKWLFHENKDNYT